MFLAGAALDTSCGTKLNTDRGILAMPPDWHAGVINTVFRSITREAPIQWVEAIIESGVAASLALRAAAHRYEDANYRMFVQKLLDAAEDAAPGCRLSSTREQELLSICSKGPAAIQRAVTQRAVSCAEIECMLEMYPEDAAEITARSLRRQDAGTYNHDLL